MLEALLRGTWGDTKASALPELGTPLGGGGGVQEWTPWLAPWIEPLCTPRQPGRDAQASARALELRLLQRGHAGGERHHGRGPGATHTAQRGGREEGPWHPRRRGTMGSAFPNVLSEC